MLFLKLISVWGHFELNVVYYFENELIRSASLRPAAFLHLGSVKSTVHVHVCIHIGAGLLPSTGTPSQNRGSCYQMVKQTHRPTAHNSNPLSTLLSTCLSLVHYLSRLWRMQRRGERKEREGKKRNNAEIMRISKKFLGGVFNFNHQDYPSSVAPIPPPRVSLRPAAWCIEMKGKSEHLERQRVEKVTETKSKCDVWRRPLWELSGRRPGLRPGVKSL